MWIDWGAKRILEVPLWLLKIQLNIRHTTRARVIECYIYIYMLWSSHHHSGSTITTIITTIIYNYIYIYILLIYNGYIPKHGEIIIPPYVNIYMQRNIALWLINPNFDRGTEPCTGMEATSSKWTCWDQSPLAQALQEKRKWYLGLAMFGYIVIWCMYVCIYIYMSKWQCVKTVYPCSSHQNSW